jgi:hypothetical protein
VVIKIERDVQLARRQDGSHLQTVGSLAITCARVSLPPVVVGRAADGAQIRYHDLLKYIRLTVLPPSSRILHEFHYVRKPVVRIQFRIFDSLCNGCIHPSERFFSKLRKKHLN